MIISLIKKELKANYKILFLFMAILTLYSSIIVMMYDPALNQSINMMAKSMPELFAAFSMIDPGVTLLDFIINYLYGFILIMIPFLFIVIMCYRLIAKYIDNGSFAYLLNSSHSRIKVIINQYITLILYLFVLILYISCFTYIFASFQFDETIDISAFILLNTGLFCLHVLTATLCFCFACSFNEIKYSIGIPSGMLIIFLLIQMLSNVSDKIKLIKYLTPLTMFQPKGLIEFQCDSIIKIIVFVFLSIILLILTISVFKKRDLPL